MSLLDLLTDKSVWNKFYEYKLSLACPKRFAGELRRFIDEEMARKIMDEYFSTEFEGGRHQRRIDKIPVK